MPIKEGSISAPSLVLLATSDCALCDEAQAALMAMPQAAGWLLRVRDIAIDADDSAGLIAHYGERIPVLQLRGGDGDCLGELDWPFDDNALAGLFKRCLGANG